MYLNAENIFSTIYFTRRKHQRAITLTHYILKMVTPLGNMSMV